jgi:hypothetical protein
MLSSCGEAVVRWIERESGEYERDVFFRCIDRLFKSSAWSSPHFASDQSDNNTCAIVGSENFPNRLPSINKRPKGGVHLIAERRRVST